MDGEQKFYLAVIAVIAIGICILTAIVTGSYTQRMKFYVENDYCETTVAGHGDLVMQKCEE